jgi:hypothetical protein
MSLCGFQSESKMKTVSAVARLMPCPPARVDSRNTSCLAPGALKASMRFCRSWLAAQRPEEALHHRHPSTLQAAQSSACSLTMHVLTAGGGQFGTYGAVQAEVGPLALVQPVLQHIQQHRELAVDQDAVAAPPQQADLRRTSCMSVSSHMWQSVLLAGCRVYTKLAVNTMQLCTHHLVEQGQLAAGCDIV